MGRRNYCGDYSMDDERRTYGIRIVFLPYLVVARQNFSQSNKNEADDVTSHILSYLCASSLGIVGHAFQCRSSSHLPYLTTTSTSYSSDHIPSTQFPALQYCLRQHGPHPYGPPQHGLHHGLPQYYLPQHGPQHDPQHGPP